MVARFWSVLGRWEHGDVAPSLMRAAGTTYQQRLGWEGTSQPIPCAMGSDISHHITLLKAPSSLTLKASSLII